MTGLLCPTGYALFSAWVGTAQQVNNTSRTDIIPEKIIVQVTQQRGDEYYTALDEYKAHRANCQVCKEKGY